jgi:D-sedoheptulose 7-phosphate isomerase
MTDVLSELLAHRAVLDDIVEKLVPQIESAAEALVTCLCGGGKILLFGNGGSAGDAQHIAAELVGRYLAPRRPLSAIALTTDSSIITAIANDYSFDIIFERQIEALARPGDLVIGISTSGESLNIVRGIEKARMIGCCTIGLLGRHGGRVASVCDYPLVVPAEHTARIQEMHIIIGHILCQIVDDASRSGRLNK